MEIVRCEKLRVSSFLLARVESCGFINANVMLLRRRIGSGCTVLYVVGGDDLFAR